MATMGTETQASPQLDSFLSTLFEGLEGYIYLAATDPSKPKGSDNWHQTHLHYPTQETQLKTTIQQASATHDVYIAPVVFTQPSAKKKDVKATNVIWADFDGNAPKIWDTTEEPSLIVQSSTSDRQHVYWKLDEPLDDIQDIETANRNQTTRYGADKGGWDANQLLRPPHTLNHKYAPALPVETVFTANKAYPLDHFGKTEYDTGDSDDTQKWELGELPSVQTVLLRYAFTDSEIALMNKDSQEIDDRSSSLQRLAYAGAEKGMNHNEILALLIHADNSWNKYAEREDQLKHLTNMVKTAKEKHPDNDEDDFEAVALGFNQLLSHEFNLEWAVEPMLVKGGNMVLAGPGGVGKTQFTLRAAIYMALGEPFLGYEVHGEHKILFLSLEMGLGEIKHFSQIMAQDFQNDPEKMQKLNENLIIVPHGEPWFLNEKQGQEYLLSLLETYQPDGLIVDSVSTAVNGTLSADDVVKPLLTFNSKIRKKYDLFVWYVHHLRKMKPDEPITQADIYGDQYIFNATTSTYVVFRESPNDNDKLIVRNLKHRLAAEEDDYGIIRTDTLGFQLNEELKEAKELEAQVNKTAGKLGL